MSAASILRLNAALRTAYGIGALFGPDALARAMKVPPPEDDARYLNALFGGRDLTVAGITVKQLAERDARGALRTVASCEGTDLLAWVQEARRRGGVDRTVAIGVAFNAVGLLTCLLAARRLP